MRDAMREVNLAPPEPSGDDAQGGQQDTEGQPDVGSEDNGGESDLPSTVCTGYSGNDNCCQNHNPCDLANNTVCECDGLCDWDGSDCNGGGDALCTGYTGWDDYCCAESNPCSYSNDSICDCQGYCSWDTTDCSGGGDDGGSGEICAGFTGDDDCCTESDPCLYSYDGWCDCDGTCSWDTYDCSGGGGDDGGDDGGEICPGYTGSSTCCEVGDPCGWANDTYCDCQGYCSWDTYDCY